MLNGLRYFEHALKNDGRGHEKEAFSWGAVEKSSVARCFVDLCARVGNIFSSEPRLLEVSSPVYVLGTYVCEVCMCVCVCVCVCDRFAKKIIIMYARCLPLL